MSYYDFRLLLQRCLILLLEFSILRYRKKLASAPDQVDHVRVGNWFIGIEHLVNLHDQSRNHPQPGKLRVIYDELQEFSAVYATVRALEALPFHLQECLVQMQ